MAHNPFPFRHDAHPDLTKAIRGVVSESHTKSQLEKMSITRLRELKKKYEGLVVKGDKDASRELADIRGLLRSKGAGVVVDEGVSPCEAAAAKRLKAADAEDLKEKPGAAGKAAHKRLHKTIKSVVGEGVIRDTVQRVKNKLRGAGGRTDAELDAMPKRVFMPANPRAVRQQKLEDSKKPGTTWDTKADEFGQQRIGAKNADGDVRYFRSSERGRAESWARGRTKHKRANFPGDPYAD